MPNIGTWYCASITWILGARREVLRYYPCSEPDGISCLLIIRELQSLCILVLAESFDFSVKEVKASFIALV